MFTLFLFLITFIYRFSYVLLFLTPLKYNLALPYQNFIRAQRLLEGLPVFYPDAWSSYYLILAVFYKLFNLVGLESKQSLLLIFVNLILGSLSVVVFYLIAKKVVSSLTAIISSVILAAYYPLIYLNAVNISENFFVFFLLVSIYLLLKNKTALYILSGISFGLAIICKPALLPFLPLLIFWLVFYEKNFTYLVKKIMCLMLPIILIVLSIGLINQKVARRANFTITGNGGVVFTMAQCEAKKIEYDTGREKFFFRPPVYWNTEGKIIKTGIPFYSDQWFYYKMGFDCLINHPVQLVKNLTHVTNVFWSIFYPRFPTDSLHFSQLSFWKVVSLVFLILFIFYPFLENNSDKRRVYFLLFLLFLSLVVAVYVANPGEERYLAPYFFILNLFGLASGQKLISQALKLFK